MTLMGWHVIKPELIIVPCSGWQMFSIIDSHDVFSSPELKAQGELLWSLTVRRRRPYVRPSIHNL